MAEQLMNPRGTRDYYGQEEQLRKYIRQTLETVFEQYGYEEAETSVVNVNHKSGHKPVKY